MWSILVARIHIVSLSFVDVRTDNNGQDIQHIEAEVTWKEEQKSAQASNDTYHDFFIGLVLYIHNNFGLKVKFRGNFATIPEGSTIFKTKTTLLPYFPTSELTEIFAWVFKTPDSWNAANKIGRDSKVLTGQEEKCLFINSAGLLAYFIWQIVFSSTVKFT